MSAYGASLIRRCVGSGIPTGAFSLPQRACVVPATKLLTKMRPRTRQAGQGSSILLLTLTCASFVAGPRHAACQARVRLGSVEVAGSNVVMDDGEALPWPEGVPVRDDSLAVMTRDLLVRYQRRGYWYAMLDSIRVSAGIRRFHVTPGPPTSVGLLAVEGVPGAHREVVETMMTLEPGDTFDQIVLTDDVGSVMRWYDGLGFPLATATVKTDCCRGDATVDVSVVIDPGVGVVLRSVELAPEIRTSGRLVARLAGLEVGAPLRGFDPDAVRRRLEATGLFRSVGEARVQTDVRGNATLLVSLVENDPGSFDLVLGYQSRSDGSGDVVGQGHIALSNLFGGARTLSMRLDRLSGRASTVEATANDPYVLGSWFGAGLSFLGEQRDSTYARQDYGASVQYRVTSSLRLAGTLDRIVTQPGQAGLALVGGRQRIPDSRSLFAGIGVRVASLDFPANPRSGIEASTDFSRGRKNVRSVQVADGDTLSIRESLRQERLSANVRLFLPVLDRHVFALGADAAALLSDRYDEADLIRIGGARSLRGYNEDQFTGRFVGRGLFEYRFIVDRLSYVFAFIDIGYVETPTRAGVQGSRMAHPGFGIGAQFRTAIGVVNATYGLNDDDGPLNGKIHVGLSFSL